MAIEPEHLILFPALPRTYQHLQMFTLLKSTIYEDCSPLDHLQSRPSAIRPAPSLAAHSLLQNKLNKHRSTSLCGAKVTWTNIASQSLMWPVLVCEVFFAFCRCMRTGSTMLRQQIFLPLQTLASAHGIAIFWLLQWYWASRGLTFQDVQYLSLFTFFPFLLKWLT